MQNSAKERKPPRWGGFTPSKPSAGAQSVLGAKERASEARGVAEGNRFRTSAEGDQRRAALAPRSLFEKSDAKTFNKVIIAIIIK